MRIGFVELLLILLIASLTIGPSAALWVDRWLRRANRASAAAARRRAVQEAQRAAEREEVLQRFQKLSIVFTLAAVAALVWALVLRPIEAPPKPTPPRITGRPPARRRQRFPPTAGRSGIWAGIRVWTASAPGMALSMRRHGMAPPEETHQRSGAHRRRQRCGHPERRGRADRLCV